ncbi:MAG: VWA domain-containing protein [Polyangiaceae bacterium]
MLNRHKTALLALFASTALFACAPTTPPITRVPETPVATTPAVTPPPAAIATTPPVRAEDLVDLSVVTSNRWALADKPTNIEVRVHLKAKPRKSAKRPPINLGLVVDTSGSMEGSAIEDARKASLALLDSLSEGDRLALVVFHSTTEVLVPSTVLTKENMSAIRTKIAAMKASGTTDLAGGLNAGLAQVASVFRADGINRVVLLGDGVPNDPSQIPGLAQRAASQRIAITTLGLGLDYDETLMSNLSLTSGGRYHYLKDSTAVAKVFTDEVLRLKQVVGGSTTVTLSPGPGVVVKDVIGLPTQQYGGKSVVMLGDMSEGDERDVLVRLEVAGRHAGSVVELLDAEAGFANPDQPSARLSERAFASVKSSADAAEIEAGRDKDVEHAVAKMGLADAIVKSVALARAGDLSGARKLLDAAEKLAKAAAKEFDDKDLADKLKSIPEVKKQLPKMVPPPMPMVAMGPTKRALAPGGAPAEAPAPDAPMAPAKPSAPLPAPVPAVVMKSQADAMGTIMGM